MCPILIDGVSARELIPELFRLTFKQPQRLSDIFNAEGLRLSENTYIRAFGNKPYISVYVFTIKGIEVSHSITISPIDFLNNTYLKFGLSASLTQMLNEINARFCYELKIKKIEPTKPFLIIKEEHLTPMLMISCPKLEKYVIPNQCELCYYFIEHLTDHSITCKYSRFDANGNNTVTTRTIKPITRQIKTNIQNKKSYVKGDKLSAIQNSFK